MVTLHEIYSVFLGCICVCVCNIYVIYILNIVYITTYSNTYYTFHHFFICIKILMEVSCPCLILLATKYSSFCAKQNKTHSNNLG